MLQLGYVSLSVSEMEKVGVVFNCDSDCDCWCDYDACDD